MYTHTHAVEYYTTIKNNEYKYTIKDTRTKSRGRIEVREGGETRWGGWRDGEKMQTIVTE